MDLFLPRRPRTAELPTRGSVAQRLLCPENSKMTRARWGFIAVSTSVLLAMACGTETSVFGPGGDPTGGGEAITGTFPVTAPSRVEDTATPDASVDLNACAVDKQEGKLAPLDLVVMQDTSGSMWTYTDGTTTTKWTAIKQALGSFMTDPESAGIGMGIQFFPLFENGVPNSCTTNAECGAAGGGCLYKYCSKTGNLCDSSADCPGANNACTDLKRCSTIQEYICSSTSYCGSKNAGTCDQPIVRGVCNAQSFSCTVADYSGLAAPVAPLPGAATAINTALDARIPNGLTPTHAALQGAINAAKAQQAAHPERVVAVVLSTDGIPNTKGKPGCTDDTNAIAAVAEAAKNGTPSIKTFVIGVLSPQDNNPNAAKTLNEIAAAGGTNSATIIGTSATTQADFIAALQKVRGESLPCEFTLPVPKAGTPDYNKVNVLYTDPATKTQTLIKYVGSKANCDAAEGGWYYDVDPQTGAKPSKVVLCATSCATVQKGLGGAVDVVQGCATQTQNAPK